MRQVREHARYTSRCHSLHVWKTTRNRDRSESSCRQCCKVLHGRRQQNFLHCNIFFLLSVIGPQACDLARPDLKVDTDRIVDQCIGRDARLTMTLIQQSGLGRVQVFWTS